MSQKCGNWLYIFATVVANTNIMLEIAYLELSSIKKTSKVTD
jgi:hypothetical protein